MAVDLGVEVPKNSKKEEEGKLETPQEKKVVSIFSAEEAVKKASNREYQNFICALVAGQDDTGKTGIVLDYASRQPKKTLVIDVDLGAYEVVAAYHGKEKKIIVPEGIIVKDDYKQTIDNMVALITYVKDHKEEYSVFVMDGLSTLLKYCEYIMRIEKNISADGGVSLRYWVERNKKFIEILEYIKSIQGIDKFFIAHEDFITSEETAAVKIKTNQMIHQRIICKKIKEKDGIGKDAKPTGNIYFEATIDKSKYNLEKQGKAYIFAKVPKTGKPTWNIEGIFEGLK
jgi:hypothetical protein